MKIKQRDLLFFIRRAAGYLLGFALFYEPFMWFQHLAGYLFTEQGFTSIHVPCARIPLASIITDDWQYSGPTSLFFCLLLAVSSLWLGPVFCGRLCPSGAFSELLGSILPDQYKIDWPEYLPVTPIRIGFFTGFLFSVWLGLGFPCAYCNYYALELFVNGIVSGHLLENSVSLIATFLLANVLLGLFTRGGRGYCMFLCPVGAACSLLHITGQHLPGPMRMQVQSSKCVGCGKCAHLCPMRSITVSGSKADININRCIVCGKCRHNCPAQAIYYASNIKMEAQNVK